jgi:predicted dehydrogenase
VNAANDTALLTLDFASGAQTQVSISAVASTIDPMKPSCTLYGERGTLESGWMFNRNMTQITPYLRGRFDDGRENINEASSFDLSFYFAAHPAGRQFVDAILEDKPIYPGLYEGYKVQQLIDAALESHQTGSRVVIPS